MADGVVRTRRAVDKFPLHTFIRHGLLHFLDGAIRASSVTDDDLNPRQVAAVLEAGNSTI